MSDRQPGDDLADWQLWFGTVVLRRIPIAFQLAGFALAIAAIAWAIVGGFEHFWIGLLKTVGGLAACGMMWAIAVFLHPIIRDFVSFYFVARERRSRLKDTRGYFLFLRSFNDDAFVVQQTVVTQGRSTTIIVENLSELLELGLAPYGRFIMIGNEPSADPFRDPSVMARSDDANWWDLFTRLVANARGVFVIPGSSDGLLREFGQVLNGPHLAKTIVVMPRTDEQRLRDARWDTVRAALGQKGYALPEYDPNGCFYMPDGQLRPVAVFPFGVSPSIQASMRRAFRTIDRKLPRDTTPFSDAITWIELEHGRFPGSLDFNAE